MNTGPVLDNAFQRQVLLRLPALMRNDLRECSTPEQAALVFECWKDLHPVPRQCHGWIWLHA